MITVTYEEPSFADEALGQISREAKRFIAVAMGCECPGCHSGNVKVDKNDDGHCFSCGGNWNVKAFRNPQVFDTPIDYQI